MVRMIWYIILLCLFGFGESALYFVNENDEHDEPLNLEFFKLLGLKVNTNSGMLRNGRYDELIPLKFKITSYTNEKKQGNNVPNLIDYKEACESLVGTSSIPLCRNIQKRTKDEKKNIPRSCQEILDSGSNKSGIYEIRPRISYKPFSVLCDMETKGGGWTHIQKRFDGSQDFFLAWREYKFGFGDLDGEFWIGLENIYHMTGCEINELLIELTDREEKKFYAQYSFFAIGPEKEGYILKNLTGFSGNAGDGLVYHLGSKFTTNDVDQDVHPKNCAIDTSGAWWYKSCYESNLNGKYMNKPLPDQYKYHGLSWAKLDWDSVKGSEYKLSGSRMLIRPVGTK